MSRRVPLLLLALLSHSLWCQVSTPASVAQGRPVLGTIVTGRRGSVVAELIDAESSAVITRSRAFPAGARMQVFLIGIPSTLNPGIYKLRIAGDALAQDWAASLQVTSRNYPRQDIPLSSNLSQLLQSDDPRKVEQWRELWALLKSFNPDAIFDTPVFESPVAELNRSSGFGLVRRYLYADGTSSTSVHNGTDLALPEGTPIIAPAAARVAMARNRVISGETIVLEHLPGVYSLYYHLTQMDVAEGDMVERGTRIGTVGSTGLATGPHLHWEVRIGGIAVDPESLAGQVDMGPFSSIFFGSNANKEGR